MHLFYLLSFLAFITSIHSAKPKTNQRHATIAAGQTFASQQKYVTPPSLPQTAPTLTQPLNSNYVTREDRKYINLFVTKIDFNKEGVSLFLHHTFNNKEYSSEFLPYSLTHLTQFLEFAHHYKQSPEFIEGAFRLFHQKSKGAPFITAYSLERFLDKTTPYLEQNLATNQSLWKSFKRTLSQTFREKFSYAQQDPLGFFEYVSKNLESQVTHQVITPMRVRAIFLRFLTHNTDKLLWSVHDQELTWQSFKKLGNIFHQLHTTGVIPDPLDANELYWSLVERYCYFLKLSGTQLSLDACKMMKRDLLHEPLVWIHQKEQESMLETKIERVLTAILETEAKIHAKAKGIITDIFPQQ